MRCTLLLVASLAGLAVAQPIVECKNTSTSTLPKDEATEQPMPTPTKLTSGSLKPFKLPAKGQGSVVLLCGVHINSKKLKSEDCVGTERFCNEALYRDLEETFASPEECLASQQPKKTAVTEKDLRKDEATKLHEDAVSCFDALDEVFKQCRESKMDDCRKGKADVQQCKSEADKQCVLETEDEAARCRKLPDTVPGKERDPLNNQAAQKSERKKIDDHCGRFGDDGEKKSECNLAVRRCVGRVRKDASLEDFLACVDNTQACAIYKFADEHDACVINAEQCAKELKGASDGFDKLAKCARDRTNKT